MPPVRAIAVCGDLVRGCQLGAHNFEQELRDQYAIAQDLLTRLTRDLLGGDKSRLIVVPGNHDVCWNTARSAMVEASSSEYDDIFNLLHSPATRFRWDWGTRKLFKITNVVHYGARLGEYRRFFEGLYGNALPEAVNGEAWLFPVDNILFVGFESCSSTDCFNRAAAIGADTIAQVATALRSRRARLRVAVWHHNIEGSPTTSDYLDQSCVRKLMYYGFRLGLHGHQHYAATAPVYIHTDRDQVMAVISAGSLCAGRRELPPGRNRGFNFLVIDEDQHSASVRSLAMDMEARVQPEYAFNGGSAERVVLWTPAPTETTAIGDARTAILEAEQAKHKGHPAQASAILLSHFSDLGVYGRSLLLEALLAQGALDEVLRLLGQQLGPEEAPKVISALIEACRPADAELLLDRYKEILVPDAISFFCQRIKLLKAGVTDGR